VCPLAIRHEHEFDETLLAFVEKSQDLADFSRFSYLQFGTDSRPFDAHWQLGNSNLNRWSKSNVKIFSSRSTKSWNVTDPLSDSRFNVAFELLGR